MEKRITLNNKDVNELKETIDYFLSDDKEKNDFLEQLADRNVNIDDIFNEHEVLILNRVPNELKSHIYYRLCYLNEEILCMIYG